ncbi:dTDP-4-keto-6-deoxy-D-glucose epimerase [Alteromonas sp. 345S023]|uniref:dTDP-4-dehydrorhamnose 3,5-epimerase n=1 Tax=Alteromonas profundi TaxID=2696062 RepID=A0A7X5LIA8_9ALTE|nr:dTDP-4-keto-6-deoxy-D-glucose epimerase [Alteromonas profundi]
MQLECFQKPIKGVVEVLSPRFGDERGSFSRWFCAEQLCDYIENLSFRQINHSENFLKGTVRGLHYQLGPQREYKVVRCIRGRVLDVVVDLRETSDTFLQLISVELCAARNNALIIPPGCAHGFQVLEHDSQLLYLHTADYLPNYEGGVHLKDPMLNIQWPLSITEISVRDIGLPELPENFKGLSL